MFIRNVMFIRTLRARPPPRGLTRVSKCFRERVYFQARADSVYRYHKARSVTASDRTTERCGESNVPGHGNT